MRRSRVSAVICVVIGITLAFGGMTWAAPATYSFGPFDVTFYNNGDADGFQGSTQDWTAQQIADVGTAVQAWASGIANVPGRQVSMHVFWQDLDPGVLGGSASYRLADGTTQWNTGEYVYREGLNPGPMPLGFDTYIVYDKDAAGVGWNFGDGAPGANIDFRSVVTHEIGHSLGWSSTFDNGFDDWGDGGDGLTAWDRNLVDSEGNRAVNGGTGIPGNFNELDNPVFWDGPNAMAENGGALVPIFAPDPWQQGSSLSHLDEGTFPNLLMGPYFSAGQMIRSVSDLEWAMMLDMGWDLVGDVAAVPAPGALLLGSLGVSLVGWLRRRRAV